MSGLYPSWANTAYRSALLLLSLIAAGLVVGPMICVRTPYSTGQFRALDQPVEFDHRHHVRDDGIACLYCHEAAETSATAGLPTTDVCMGCHAQVWNGSPALEAVRQSYFSGQPIRWRRVHDLAGFVYFDHAVHVRGGIDCSRCHGDVGGMARVEQVQPLTMGWCLDCHRDPARQIAGGSRPGNAWSATVALFTDVWAGHRAVTPLVTCSACHR
jgi:predicted CXXCH cytochrome family protein